MTFRRSYPRFLRDRILRPLWKPTAKSSQLNYNSLSNYPDFKVRSEFVFAEHPHFVPAHEGRALQRLPRLLSSADAVLEVRDARAPFSTAVTEKAKIPRVVLLNKADLISAEMSKKIRSVFEKENIPVVAISAIYRKNIGQIKNHILSNLPIKHASLGIRVAIIGMPNMGKSSLIEALKVDTMNKVNLKCINPKLSVKIQNKQNLHINKLPGTTKTFNEFLINHKPLIKVIDTPGVTMRKDINEIERNVKLASLGIFPDHIYGERNIADYILYTLNVRKEFFYVQFFELQDPTDSIDQLLSNISDFLAQGKLPGPPDLLTAARCFIRNFRDGKLGKIALDHIPDDEDLEALSSLEWETEPPSPWGPETYQLSHEARKWKSLL